MPLSVAEITASLKQPRHALPLPERHIIQSDEPTSDPLWWNRRTLQWQRGPKPQPLTPEQRAARRAASKQRAFRRAATAHTIYKRRYGTQPTHHEERAKQERRARRRDPKTSKMSKEARRFLRQKDPKQLYCRFAPDGCGGWKLTVPTWLTTDQAAALRGDPTLGPRITTSQGVISGADCHIVGCRNALVTELWCLINAARNWLTSPTLPSRGILAPRTQELPQPTPPDRSGWWNINVGPFATGFLSAWFPPPAPPTVSTEHGQYVVATTWASIRSGQLPPWHFTWTPMQDHAGDRPPPELQTLLDQQGP